MAFVLFLLIFAFFLLNYTRRVDGVSMLPTLESGDLVVIEPVSMSDVQIGNIIVYGPPCAVSDLSVIHRVVGGNDTSGFITQGDDRRTNPATDQTSGIASRPITQACLIGKVVFVVPYVERLASLPYGLNYVIAALIFLAIVASELGGKSTSQRTGGGEKAVGSVESDDETRPNTSSP
jgi:signal peptidase